MIELGRAIFLEETALNLRSENEYAVGWYAPWDLPFAKYRQPGQVDTKQDEIFKFLNKEIAVYIDADTVGNMDLGYLGRYLYLAWLHLHEGRPPFQGGGFFPKPFQIPKQTAESLDELSSFHRDLTHTLSVHLDDPVHFQQGRDHATIASQPVSPSIQSFKDHCYLIRPLFRVIYMVVDDQALAEYTKPLPVPERENEDWMALRSQFRVHQVLIHTILLVRTGQDSHLSFPQSTFCLSLMLV
ncbi:Uncharacterized protein HZ326_10567 [Fusarium oxysporum f. sp. albedinis]|nr:Uncharacterized protein HZ326_10567 [Fusarium oxysporum f. sp. albedinis]